MSDRGIDARSFWEQKILVWERDRYGGGDRRAGVLERIASRSGGSLRFRLAYAGRFLSRHVAEKRVTELGCGSGLLAEDLIRAGAASYRGLDIAANALARAEERVRAAGLADRISFARADVAALPDLDTDFVFSLGLLDWLTPDEIDRLFAAGGKADFLHSIAERRRSLKQWLHRGYVHLAYGHRTGGYVPRYHSVEEIATVARRHGHDAIHVFRDRRLSFGALISSIPFD